MRVATVAEVVKTFGGFRVQFETLDEFRYRKTMLVRRTVLPTSKFKTSADPQLAHRDADYWSAGTCHESIGHHNHAGQLFGGQTSAAA